MRRIRAALLVSLLCSLALVAALPAAPAVAAERAKATTWCELELEAWQREFGREGRSAWLGANGSVRVCARLRERVVTPIDDAAVDAVIALHLASVQACGAERRADPLEFDAKYGEQEPSEFYACTSRAATVAAGPRTRPGDFVQAARLCKAERRAWTARGQGRAWRRERVSLDACVRAEGLLVAAKRGLVGSGPAIQREVTVLIHLRRQLLAGCLSALREGRFRRVEAPSQTRLGTCVRSRERPPPLPTPSEPDRLLPVDFSLAAATAALLLAWLLGYGLLVARRREEQAPGWGFHAAVSLPLVVAAAVVVASEVAGDPEYFELESRVKDVVLPLAGVAFLAVAGWAWRAAGRRVDLLRPDAIMAALIALTAVGAVVGLARGNPTTGLLEDLGLGMLFAAAYAAGRVDRPPGSGTVAPRVLLALLAVAFVATVTHAPTTPLYGLALAVSFAGLLAVLGRKLPPPVALFAVATVVVLVYDTNAAGSVPSSLYLQLAAGVALIAYWLTRRFVPTWAWAAVLVLGLVVALAATDARSVATGDYDGTDLSFAQRAYEARAVRSELRDSPVDVVLGAGLGATVDLSRSPDVATLVAARGSADAVNDVHLLPWDLVRRHGVLGALWLAAFLGLCLVLVARVRGSTDAWTLLMLFGLAIGTADAVPAASHLFANPLAGFALGALVSATFARRPGC